MLEKIYSFLQGFGYFISKINFFRKTIIFLSNKGIGYSGNVKLAFESEGLRRELNGYRFVYLSRRKDGLGIYLWSIRGVFLALFSKYYIISVVMPPFVSPKNKCVIQLWHGIPMKCIGVNARVYSELHKKRLVKEFNSYNYILVSGDKFKSILKESFHISDDSVFIYSANFVQEDLLLRRKSVREKNFILYAPTFREYYGRCWDLLKFREILEKWLSDNNLYMYCKYHPNDIEASSFISSDRIIIVDRNEDINEYILQSKCVITDYSSVAFDASMLDKEIYFYVADLDKYSEIRGICGVEILREYGFYADVEELLKDISTRKGVLTARRINLDFHNHISDIPVHRIISNLVAMN